MGVESLLEEADLMMLGVEVDRIAGDRDRLLLRDIVPDAATRPGDDEREEEDRDEQGRLENGPVSKRGPGSSVGRQRNPAMRDSR